MKTLNVNTGIITYTVNDSCEISFNPTNPEFAGKIVRAFQRCTEIAQGAKENYGEDFEALMALTEKMDAETRKEIDAAFDEPVCDKVFGRTNVLSFAGGLPVWANFLMVVIDEIDRNLPEEEKKARPAVQKYVKKYETKYGKKKNGKK